jgi:S-adenosyl-L-methionine hydrolase (adenosine-forming)
MAATFFHPSVRTSPTTRTGRRWGRKSNLAKLARLDIGPAHADEHGLRGEVIATDGPYGNLVTNINADDFVHLGYQRGQNVPVMIGEKKMNLPFVRTFSDVAVQHPLLYIDSRGRLALAVNQGSFAAIYGIKPPVALVIPRAGK